MITIDPDIQGGAPCIAGTRMPVRLVQHVIRDDGRDYFKRNWAWLTDEQIDAALAYDGDIRDEEEIEADEARALREVSRDRLVDTARKLVAIERVFQYAGPGWPVHERQLRRAAFATVLALLLGALVSLAPVRVEAQSDVDLLMRTVVSECGWECVEEEVAALHAVIRGIERREHVGFAAAWSLASPRLAAGTVSRAWLADIHEHCEEPEGWPTYVYEREGDLIVRRPHPPWSAYRDRCGMLAVVVRWVLSGWVRAECEPRSWGSTSDAARSFAGLVFVRTDCGETRNVFGEWMEVDRD